MLIHEQRRHFARKGWVLLEGVFDAPTVAAFTGAVERADRFHAPSLRNVSPDTRSIDSPLFFDDIFLQWFRTSALIEANKQCLGTGIRYNFSAAIIQNPHPDRHTEGGELSQPDNWRWQRGLRPKWGTFTDDADPELINAHFLRNLTFLSDVAPDGGSPVVLSGSHRTEGDYPTLRSTFPAEAVTAHAGDVLLFTETLLHAHPPIQDDTPRLYLDYGFSAPWFRSRDGMAMPLELTELLADAELRELFDGHTYIEQEPV